MPIVSSGLPEAEVEGGFLEVYVKYRGIPVHLENDDLCEKTACPVRPGSFVLHNVQRMPSVAFAVSSPSCQLSQTEFPCHQSLFPTCVHGCP